jgi:SHS2 domain-containing protein
MPELIFSGFGTEDITIDLTGKTPEEAIEQAIEQINEKGKK